MRDTSGFLKFRGELELAINPDPYIQWIGENFDRLSAQILESGCINTRRWIQQQYRLETGKQP